jgi:hypothetical protein
VCVRFSALCRTVIIMVMLSLVGLPQLSSFGLSRGVAVSMMKGVSMTSSSHPASRVPKSAVLELAYYPGHLADLQFPVLRLKLQHVAELGAIQVNSSLCSIMPYQMSSFHSSSRSQAKTYC